MMKKITAITLLALSISHANAGDFSFSSVGQYFQDEWTKSNTTDLYIPTKTWHNRADYSAEKIKSFNEMPWGLGLGRSYRDDNSNWHGYYAMVFADSHSKPEPIAGYAYVKNLVGHKDSFNAGVGYTLFVTARDDYNYIPIPAALPIVSVGYKQLTINGTYIPGGKGNGNVAFIWTQYNFK